MTEEEIKSRYAELVRRMREGCPVNYEAQVEKLYRLCLMPGMVAIDVGAHDGRHCIPMAQCVHPGGTIEAYEPLAELREKLAMRLSTTPELKNTVNLHAWAIGNSSGQTRFFRAEGDLGYSGLQIREYDKPETTPVEITVEVRQLDELFQGSRLDFIKLDIEGGEYDALSGGRRLLDQFRPICAFEFGGRSYRAYNVDEGRMYDLFSEYGYTLYDIVGNALLTRELFVCSTTTGGLWDYFALPPDYPSSNEVASGMCID